MVLTIQELCSSEKEGVDLRWVGDEALMDSTHPLVLCPPLISRFFKMFLLEMEMYPPPGAAGGFCATIPDLVSVTTTFFCVIFWLQKTKPNSLLFMFSKKGIEASLRWLMGYI